MCSTVSKIGKKVRLLSRAQIRYEGMLLSLDQDEYFITLANVRSFGTEDRYAVSFVPSQTEVYDFVVFRGYDLLEISVVEDTPLPNDPAIMQLSVPSHLASTGYQTQGFSRQIFGNMGAGIPQYPTYGEMGALTCVPSALAPGTGLDRDSNSLPRQPSELVIPVQVTELPANKNQGARYKTVFAICLGMIAMLLCYFAMNGCHN